MPHLTNADAQLIEYQVEPHGLLGTATDRLTDHLHTVLAL